MSHESYGSIVNTSLENVLVIILVRIEEKTIVAVNEIIGDRRFANYGYTYG